MKKRILAFAMATFMTAAGLMSGQMTSVYAAEDNVAEQQDDPEYGRANGYMEDGFFDEGQNADNSVYSTNTNSTYTGGGYIHNGRFDGYPIINGIDVSKYQKDINWSAVKAAGIDFAFVRVGYRGASSGTLNTDPYYVQNLKNAVAAGVRVGVYIYSQAVTTDEAVEEANYVLSLIAGYDVTMPVVIDFEYDAYHTGRLYKANLSRQTATDICNAFCAKVEENGYTGMVYANKGMLKDSMNASGIPYLIWLANYTSQTTYNGNYTCWQYTSKGTVNGISGDVDCNFWYGSLKDNYNTGMARVPVYRLYQPSNGEHLYTTDAHERDVLYQTQGWGYEGIAWYAANGTGEPVYRLYNANQQNHLYTTDVNEVNILTNGYGWVVDFDGQPLFYSDGDVPVYRVYNEALSGMHHLTTDQNEYNTLPQYGWIQEGKKISAVKIGNPIITQYFK